MNKSKILFVLPTLKQDGAEVQISNLLSYFENFKVDIFTFDLFKEGSSIFRDLEGIKVYTKNRNTNLRALKKIIESNVCLSVRLSVVKFSRVPYIRS